LEGKVIQPLFRYLLIGFLKWLIKEAPGELTASPYIDLQTALEEGAERKEGNMNTLTSETRNQIRPKVAVVVGSGGIKSLAAIALFEFLHQAQIKIDLMVGCSGGALICALLGAGYMPAQCRDLVAQFLDRKLFSQVDYRSILGLANSRLGRFGKDAGMFKPQALQDVYCQVFLDLRLENLHP